VDNITGDSSPFSPMYIQGDLFNTTLKLIVDYNKILYKYRLDYYEKLLHRCSTLSKSSSSKLFSGYISDAINDIYPNKDKEWVTRTSFES
jgi:hypothetical protein